MLAIQQSNQVSWVHQDPVTKSQQITNSSGTVTSTVDLDPWGGETARSNNQAFQPHRYTTYERDGNSGDDAMMRRYTGKWHRFDQPDPSDGSYDLTNPQSFNRYSYTQNDPVNFIDPTGLQSDYLCEQYGMCSGGGTGANVGWSGVSAGFWGSGNLMDRPHPRDGAIGDKPPSLQCPPGHICFLQPVENREIWRYLLVDFGPQSYGIDDIIGRARARGAKIDQNLKAWVDYQNCVSSDPAAIAYSKALNAATLKASLPIPGPIPIGRVAIGKTGVVASLAANANVFTLVAGGMVHVLLANPMVETQALRDKVRPVEDRCKSQTKANYGFTPVLPY